MGKQDLGKRIQWRAVDRIEELRGEPFKKFLKVFQIDLGLTATKFQYLLLKFTMKQ